MNYFKSAEQLLSSVPALEKAVGNAERRKQRIIDSGQVKKAVLPADKFTDAKTASAALSAALELPEIEKNIAETKRVLLGINEALGQLQDEHKRIILMWYTEKRTKEYILQHMNIESLSTLYNLRNTAVAEFALLYYGASAIPSI